MNPFKSYRWVFLCLFLSVLLLFVVNISLGTINIPFLEVIKTLFTGHSNKTSWQYIILNYRLPKAISGLLVGVALATSGLLMQTLFKNPLTEPYVLGLSSGASLSVAIVVLGASVLPLSVSSLLLSPYGLVLAATLGSFFVLILVLFLAHQLQNTMTILVIGVLFGSLTNAVVGTLTYFSSAEALQKFTFWSLGNLSNLSWNAICVLGFCICLGLFFILLIIKNLDTLLLGENYAKSMGVNYKKTRFLIILSASILSGSCTAFVGPIAFVGLAVPHLAKLVFKTSNHLILFCGTLLFGGLLMLFCDGFSQWPGTNNPLPINAVTSIFGAPLIIWLLIKKPKNLM